MTFLIAIMSFANFVFYPLVVGTIIAVIIEQILRATGNEYDPKAVKNVTIAMGIRKYLWRQSWVININWFVCNLGLYFVARNITPVDNFWSEGL